MADARRANRRQAQAPNGVFVDRWVLGAALALGAIGLVMVVSSSISVATREMGMPLYYAYRQGTFFILGAIGATVIFFIPLDWMERFSPLALPAALIALLLVFVPGLGVRVNGSLRWIDLGIANFQVAEGVKLLLVVYLAGYLVRQQSALEETIGASLKAMGVSLLMALLLLMQPDYGTALIVVAMAGAMVWLAGARLRYLVALGLTVVPLMASAALLEPYRITRLTTFLDPWENPFDEGFQLVQALIAVGRGEWFGVGLGASVQKLFYLPEAHTDFIFAVIAEELGVLGICVVLGLFCVLVGRALWLGFESLQAGRSFGGYLAYGIGVWLALQAFISGGVNLGLLPTKGLTLPFISYGGSSLVVTCAATGFLLRVSRELHRKPAPRARPNQRAAHG